MKILIINGPNLNLLGKREPDIYGKISFKEYLSELKQFFSDIQLDCVQTNHEGVIIDELQKAENKYNAIVINPAAYTHTSIAIADTVKAISLPVIEVHISNIHKREPYRKISYISENVVKTIAGKGLDGYKEAILYFLQKQ